MKLKATPPKPSADNQDERIAAIIAGATATSPAPSPSPAAQPTARQVVAVPWKAPYVGQDLMVQVNVRLPEPLALKLSHVSYMTDRQKQELVAAALEPLLNAKLREIGYTEEDL